MRTRPSGCCHEKRGRNCNGCNLKAQGFELYQRPGVAGQIHETKVLFYYPYRFFDRKGNDPRDDALLASPNLIKPLEMLVRDCLEILVSGFFIVITMRNKQVNIRLIRLLSHVVGLLVFFMDRGPAKNQPFINKGSTAHIDFRFANGTNADFIGSIYS